MVKGKSTKKIDAAIGLAMACVAAVQMPTIDISMALVGRRTFDRTRDWITQREDRDNDDYQGGSIGRAFDDGSLSRGRRWDW